MRHVTALQTLGLNIEGMRLNPLLIARKHATQKEGVCFGVLYKVFRLNPLLIARKHATCTVNYAAEWQSGEPTSQSSINSEEACDSQLTDEMAVKKLERKVSILY